MEVITDLTLSKGGISVHAMVRLVAFPSGMYTHDIYPELVLCAEQFSCLAVVAGGCYSQGH